jgi:hypothetical protein
MHSVRRSVDFRHIERCPSADGEAAALSDGVIEVPPMRAELNPVGINDRSRNIFESTVLLKKSFAPHSGDETKVLAVRSIGNCNLSAFCLRSNFGLCHCAKRKAHHRKHARWHAGKSVGLILASIDAGSEQGASLVVVLDQLSVVPSGKRMCA